MSAYCEVGTWLMSILEQNLGAGSSAQVRRRRWSEAQKRQIVSETHELGVSFGAFSNFQPLAVPLAAGPWTFRSAESLYQVAKFAQRPDIQQRIAEAPTAREASIIGRTPASASTRTGTPNASTSCAGCCA